MRPQDRTRPGRPWLPALCLALAAAGCNAKAPETAPGIKSAGASGATQAAGPAKVKIAYLGLTCEAAIFVAQEKGFFTEEGVDAELVKTDWDGLRDGLGLGRFDANYTLIMFLLKPIEQGLDVKITGGIHTGCLRIQTAANSPIKTAKDLKGKRIGVPNNLGSPPALFTNRVLANNGMAPKTDVEWVTLPPETLGLALEKGQVDAVADSEPIGSILAAQGKVRTIVDQAVDAPYKDEYCCAVVVNGGFAKRDPAAAAKLTRALLKGARWVAANPTAAAKLAVDKKYTAASTEINAAALAKLKYIPAVDRCRVSIGLAAAEMKTAGLLNPATDPAELAGRAWLDLDGVTDAWLESLKVESIAGGGVPTAPPTAQDLAAQLAAGVPTCCDAP